MKRLSKNNYTVVPALSCNNTEKLKTESIQRISLEKKNVFQFSGKYSGIVPEPKLKN